MGGDGKMDEKLSVVKKLKEDFGSLDAWKEDFISCAKASLGWAILCYDPSDGKLHNYLCDSHNFGAVWGATPLLPIDVWEHAYYRDYGPKRPGYIDAFLQNVNWSKVEELFKNVSK